MGEKRLPRAVMEWIPSRKRRGRPRSTWMEGIRRALSRDRELTEEQVPHREE